MAKFLGLVASAVGCVLALGVINLFVYGGATNWLGLVVVGGFFGFVSGAIALGYRRLRVRTNPVFAGGLAMTATWLIYVATILATAVISAPAASTFITGTIAMFCIGLVSGAAQNYAERTVERNR
jgi:hypothetical protein